MIVVTGAGGQIGGAISRRLVESGQEVLPVEWIGHRSFKLPSDVKYELLVDKEDFLDNFEQLYQQHKFTTVIHCGAISSTTETDKDLLESNNIQYTKELLTLCNLNQVDVIFASSASVYGNNLNNFEDPKNEDPLNDYAKSKLEIDNEIRGRMLHQPPAQITSLRFFNVSGGHETHKDGQSSPFHRYFKSLINDGELKMMSGDDGTGIKAEDYSRDFIYVEDVVDVVLWFLNNKQSGIYNVGTGETNKFKDIAKACLNVYTLRGHELNELGYPYFHPLELVNQKFPVHLKGKSQQYTKADISKLRSIGYTGTFLTIEQIADTYFTWLLKNLPKKES